MLLAKKLEKSNVGGTTAQKGYIKAMDSLTELQRKITAGYSKLSPDDMRSTNAITSIFKTFKQMVTDRAKATSPDLAQKIDDYSKFANLIDEWDTYVGHDKKQILGFLYNHVFADTSVENVYGREAINAMFTPEYLGGANLSHVKDLVAAIWMRGGEVATSGYKAGIPRLMAEQAGKVLGATAVGGGVGAAVGGQKGAKIGATLGFLGTLPYTNPQWTSSAYKFVEGLQNPILKQFPSSTLPNMIGKGVEFSPKLLTKPLGEAIGELSNQFGINTSQEDVNKLKASKLK